MEEKQTLKISLAFFLAIIFFLISGEKSAASGSYQDEGIAFYAQTNSFGYFYENTAFYAFSSQITDSMPVYRFYNTKNGDHFYTISENDKNIVLNNPQWGYVAEGIAFYAFTTQITDSSPVYRFYNSNNGDHFYTTSETEKNKLSSSPVYRFYNTKNGDHFYTISENDKNIVLNNPQWGYVAEGIAFYAFTTQITDSSPVYRFYNSNNGDHFYTISENDKNIVLNNPQWGYTYENITFYAFPAQIGNSLPVYRLLNSTTGDHFYTTSETERNYLLLPALGPDISVGLWYYTKSEIQSSPFQINANKNYKIKDKNGILLAEVGASSTTKVIYDANGNLKVSDSIPAVLVNNFVTFEAADGDNSTLIFDVHRPNSSLNHYRGKIKVQYYHGSDIYGGNTGSTVSQIWIINILPLEHYAWGSGEMTGTGQMEHTKVMTSIFRTYGYWYVKYATKYAPYGFKIRSDSGSQVYKGYDWETQYQNIKTASQNTRGIIASYSNDVALTPYSSWSDGRTRSYQEVWGSTSYPWCQSVPDPYGKYSSSPLPAGNHMVGLIAHGSLNLADDQYNWDYQKILKYYYTGISTNPAY